MVHPKKTENAKAKAAALISSAVIVLMSFIYVHDWSLVGISTDSPLAARFVYPFFHAGFLHSVINAWCLISIVFLYDVSLLRLLTAYFVAVLAPRFLLSDMPTVGCSCICYFLLGSLFFQVRRKLWFSACMALYIAVGFLFPAVNGNIHLYGYLAGLLVGLLNAPLSCLFPKKRV